MTSAPLRNPRIAEVIAAQLPKGLLHPGDPANNVPPTVIRLPVFNTVGMSPEQAEATVGNFAELVAESIVSLIETDGGSDIVPKKVPRKKAAPK